MRRFLLAFAALPAIASAISAQTPPVSWLDRPLSSWNKPGDRLPGPPPSGAKTGAKDESRESIVNRCRLTPPRSTAAEKAVEAAGWIPFWNFDQQLVRDDVEIVGGMRLADGMCRPASYNIFVFVGARFAGMLSPTPMTSRLDSSSGVVRMQPAGITAEFARYTSADPLCCPSSHVRVNYRIDRSPAGPVVIATEVSTRP